MMQEMHHKLMVRIRQKRDEILSSDYQVCPRIMKKVDQAVTASREWRATWDGERKYVVSIKNTSMGAIYFNILFGGMNTCFF